ncbi:MAG: hypothetical protein OD814_001729 [Candidatus Alkanophagales archaeon MCA70_species_1]|nr:hypothetical protein [Candidatus Alkanophaga volatiphilum]
MGRWVLGSIQGILRASLHLRIVKAAQECGALGAKVTGAGSSEAFGGVGCVIALPPQGDMAAELKIEAAMRAAGATSVFSTKAGAEGVKLEVAGGGR